MELTQVKDSHIKGTISPVFAELTIVILTEEEGEVTITFDYETWELMETEIIASHPSWYKRLRERLKL